MFYDISKFYDECRCIEIIYTQVSGTRDDMKLCTYFPKAQMNQKFNKDTP